MGGEDPAGTEHLDLGGTLAKLLAGCPAYLVDAVDYLWGGRQPRNASPGMLDVMGGSQIPVSTGLGEYGARREDAGSVYHSLLHQARPVGVETSRVPDGGETLLEGVLDDAPDREHVVDPGQVADASRRRDQAHVDVGIGQSGHQGQPGGVDDPIRGTSHPASDSADERPRYSHVDARPRVGAGAVQQFGVADHEAGHSSPPSW